MRLTCSIFAVESIRMISDKQPVKDLIALLQQWEVKDVIITPGSRNAPFSLSFFKHPDFRTYSIVDERTAAFFALGLSQQTKIPSVLICTSGTAALNYAPAIAEAYYQRVPLIVITADRPIEWIDQGEGQSIRQTDVYKNYVRKSVSIVQEAEDKDLKWYNFRQLNEAIQEAFGEIPGPVHINFPLRESLYNTDDRLSDVMPYHTAATLRQLTESEKKATRQHLSQAKKVMILVGQMVPNETLNQLINEWASLPQVAIFTESHANLAGQDLVTGIDRMISGLSEEDKQWITPDLLITFGHNIISRRIKTLLRNSQVVHWHIDESGEGLDTFQHLHRIIPISPLQFFTEIGRVEGNSDYREKIVAMNALATKVGEEYLKEASFSDLTALSSVMKAIPHGSHVQMGNSSIVRYIQLYTHRGDLTYFGNRGVAGIDGCTSTAIGASWITQRPTTFISGDIAFMYDSNAFWHKYISAQLKMVVINNGGGGIFRIIDGPSGHEEALEQFFETTHDRTTEDLARMFKLPYLAAHNEESLQQGLSWLYDQKECALLEVFTPRLENDAVLKGFFKKIKDKQNNH